MYILGKEPVSGFCKGYNMLAILAALGLFGFTGWKSYTSSPTYLSGKQMKAAEAALASKDYPDAADKFLEIIDKRWPDQREANDQMIATFEEGLRSDKAEDVAGLIALAPRTDNKKLVESSIKGGKRSIDRFESTDLMGTVSILKELRKLVPLDNELLAKRTTILEKVVVEKPDNIEAKTELAEVYYDGASYAKAAALLEPVQAKLEPDDRGTLFLGKSLSELGRYSDAIPLLKAYVEPKMKALRAAESKYNRESERAYKTAFTKLDNGSGPESFYTRLDAASEAEQGLIVSNQVNSMMEKDRRYMKSIEDFQKANEVVPHAFDLGLAQLFNARTLSPGDEQKTGFEEAEKTFLSFQTSAGESDEYRLFLGQVKYWLGKSDEGKELFDQLLESNKRSNQSLLMIGSTLRELGERAVAGDYFEEAYENGKNTEEKQNAATARALTVSDSEDKLKWLQRSNTESPEIQVRIANVKSRMASDRGDTEEAIKFMRESVAGLEKLGDSVSALNNRGLAYMELFELTGDPGDYQKGANEMTKALELNPNDGIIVTNSLSTLMTSSMIKVLAPHFDFKTLKGTISDDMLKMLYHDQSGYDKLTAQITAIPEFEKARSLAERGMLIAPKSPSSYGLAVRYHTLAQERDLVAKIGNSIKGQELDTAETIEETKKRWTESGAAENLAEIKISIKKQDEDLADLEAGTLEHYYSILKRAESETYLSFHGEPAQLEHHLGIAKKVQEVKPCRLADYVVTELHFSMADRELQSSTEYQSLYKATKRSWNEKDRILWALTRDDLKPQLLENEHLKAAYQLTSDYIEKFPKGSSINSWGVIHAFSPEKGQLIKKQIEKEGRVESSIAFRKAMSPLDPGAPLREYLLHRMRGDFAKADQAMAEAKERGIPLP